MQSLRFFLPTKLLFGNGALNHLGKEAGKLGKNALLVTGSSSMRRTGVLDRVIKDLIENGTHTLVFDKVEPNPPTTTIDEAAEVVRKSNIDVVIGLGGGSTMDSAKAIAVAGSGTAPIWDYFENRAKSDGPVVPIILVPTMAGTGSEGNSFTVVTNWETHEKRAIGTRFMQPRVSIIDPTLTLTLPARQTAQGGVDIFCHLVEEYITTSDTSAITDGICESVMRVVVEYLPRVLANLNDLQSRFEMSWASTIACSQFRQLGGGIETGARTLHGIEHAVSGIYNSAHGDGLAAILPAWMRLTLPARKDRFARLGTNVFGETDAIQAVEKWLARVNMNRRLREFGMNPEQFYSMGELAMRVGHRLETHPVKLDAKVIAQLYKDSY